METNPFILISTNSNEAQGVSRKKQKTQHSHKLKIYETRYGTQPTSVLSSI